MPRDDFERLERRWRKRSLFHDPPRRRPLRLLAAALAAVVALLAANAIGVPDTRRLLDVLTVFRTEVPDQQPVQTTAARIALPSGRH